VSADSTVESTIAAGRPHDRAPGTAAAAGYRARLGDPVRVAIVGATGYVGSELIRLLSLHPNVRIVGLVGREREGDPIGGIHPHLSTRDLLVHDTVPAEAETVFLALPHGAVAGRIDEFLDRGQTVIDLGPDFRLHDPADYPRWYHFDHPRADLLATAVYGLPELHRAELADVGTRPGAIVGSPGCYATTTILALAPLARAGLIGDLVVDAKSGVSGAGRDPKADLQFGEVNESVKAYGIFTHRHIGEIEQELGALGGHGANPGVHGVDFLPHLIPMTRGILSACHVRPTRPVSQPELDELYREAYGDEAFVSVVDTAPATKHVLGSNEARVWCRLDERNGRILAIGVLDNLVKGAAGQAIQAFNVVHGLPETAGLLQLPLGP
jgi:N-acetyl-gamma-glutamyl-phosphate reductase